MGVEQCDCNVNDKEYKADKLPEKVNESIERIIKKEGYKDYKVLTRAISTVGGNYFGSLYEVDVKGTTEDGEKETNIFVKGIVSGDHLTVMSVSGMFTMELFVYNELSVIFNDIQNEAHIPMNERYNMVRSFQQSIPEAIILENVARKGYKTGFRMDPVSLEFAQLSMQQLGKFHGLSFALENKRPEYFERKLKTIPFPMNFNDDFKGLLKNSAKAISECLGDDASKKFNDYIPKLWNKMQHCLFDFKYKRTLVHGDYRANNILMKEIEGELTDVLPVDYQLLCYGCPIMDILFFVFLGTDQQFRKDHLEDLKDVYFDSLTKMLQYFDIDVKTVFPREDFDNLYKEVLDYGIFCFMQLMPFIFAVEDEIPELDKDYLADVVIKTDPRMKERARGIVDDFIQWGYL
ncbi:hypothetical protein MSG28_004937 [Choristoneura fumiferana]|uniref:Uncharacterized protein n=2 Tax=Choristoneura fumiferana TaxID=7141 RepID=A0ACC0JPB7_CHOFU|nr:hypothetical protein MSG28_004937 [Choristoneura fumiferana]